MSRITIITPLYNRAKLVLETIESVRQQSHQDWELLIVDDHSTDHSLKVVLKQTELDSRIRAWARKDSSPGAPSCRNEGLAAATGTFTLFLDSDDLLSSACLKNRLSHFQQQPDFDAHIFPSEQFRKTPGDLGTPWFVSSQDYLTDFLKKPLWQTSAALWKTDSVKRAGGFRQDLLAWQDWDLFVRCLTNEYKFCVHQQATADNFIRRSLHARISQTAERNRDSIRNRRVLFRDTLQGMQEKRQLHPERIEAFRDLCITLAVKMHLTRMHKEADEWIVELSELGLIKQNEIQTKQIDARQQSRLTWRQRVNEVKLKILQRIRR